MDIGLDFHLRQGGGKYCNANGLGNDIAERWAILVTNDETEGSGKLIVLKDYRR